MTTAAWPRPLPPSSLRAALLALMLFLSSAVAVPSLARAEPAAAPEMPTDQGFPILVHVGLAMTKLDAFDESGGTFDATVNLRVRWQDMRLAIPGAKPGEAPLTLRQAAAEARLATMWVPPVVLANLKGESEVLATGLRIYPNGWVELMRRTRGSFSTPFTVSRFPFDRQALTIDIATLDEPANILALRFDQSDINFSRPARDLELFGWTIGAIDLTLKPIAAWYNTVNDQVVASLEIARQLGEVAAAIFIPLLASLLIPLLTIWLESVEKGKLQSDPVDLLNINIGGLFAVVALNFTIYTGYVFLSSGDNTVTRLFALNYAVLGVAFLINMVFSRFRVLETAFGPYVQEQAYYFLMWAVPTLVVILAAAFVLTAIV
ncbi:hypothetical protein ABLE91_19570 [Aquabacter sp. CN5-332]|uniref:hypothetical protein n=1 Tax=Aquabacter sp. CN5-332 TaxID=3156608 RepID=UPI0032B5DE1F